MVQKIARSVPFAMESPTLTILIPCLNEEPSIAAVVREYSVAFPTADMLVVDNGSEDLTAAVARAAGASVIIERRRGKATAVAAALAAIDTDLVLMVDGDGSYPAEGSLLLLQEYLREPVDMITGIRSAQNATRVFRPMHQWGMSIFAGVLKSVFRYKPLDLFSGLRLFSRRFYKHVPVLSRGFELEIELTIQAIDKDFSMTEVPVPFRSRTNGSESKLKTLRDGLRILRLFVVLFRDYRPFEFFGGLAVFTAITGLVAGSHPVLEYLRTGFVYRLPLAVLAASLMCIAVIIFLAGLLLESNLRRHREAYQIEVRLFSSGRTSRRSGTSPRQVPVSIFG
jgi:glycosyltransferase involved in cell wall biosynthesis